MLYLASPDGISEFSYSRRYEALKYHGNPREAATTKKDAVTKAIEQSISNKEDLPTWRFPIQIEVYRTCVLEAPFDSDGIITIKDGCEFEWIHDCTYEVVPIHREEGSIYTLFHVYRSKFSPYAQYTRTIGNRPNLLSGMRGTDNDFRVYVPTMAYFQKAAEESYMRWGDPKLKFYFGARFFAPDELRVYLYSKDPDVPVTANDLKQFMNKHPIYFPQYKYYGYGINTVDVDPGDPHIYSVFRTTNAPLSKSEPIDLNIIRIDTDDQRMTIRHIEEPL